MMSQLPQLLQDLISQRLGIMRVDANSSVDLGMCLRQGDGRSAGGQIGPDIYDDSHPCGQGPLDHLLPVAVELGEIEVGMSVNQFHLFIRYECVTNPANFIPSSKSGLTLSSCVVSQ